jgi:hypothetical protein
MFESIDAWFSGIMNVSVSFGNVIIIVLSSVLLGLIVSIAYMFTHRKDGWIQSFTITLVMLPAIVAIIILLVGSSVARAFSLAGAFSLIRFRSAPGDPKDISYVFFTVAIGLACGMGYIPHAALFAVIVCLVMFVLEFTKFGAARSSMMTLKVTIPENLNFKNLFDDILGKYTKMYKMKRVKTIEFGSLFELTYTIKLNDNCDQKALIDELRTRNGNLTVSLNMLPQEDKVYVDNL